MEKTIDFLFTMTAPRAFATGSVVFLISFLSHVSSGSRISEGVRARIEISRRIPSLIRYFVGCYQCQCVWWSLLATHFLLHQTGFPVILSLPSVLGWAAISFVLARLAWMVGPPEGVV
jgi:hypothetical protein